MSALLMWLMWLQVTWKKWALTPSNVSVVVAVAWWTVAHVFRPDHPLSAAVQVTPGQGACCAWCWRGGTGWP